MSCRVRIDAYTLPHIKQRASGKQLSSVLCDDLDVWDEVGGRSKREGIYVHIQLSPSSRKGQPAPGFLPGKFHGQRNLAGYRPRGRQESDTTERLSTEHKHFLPHTHLYSVSRREPIHSALLSLSESLIVTF